MPRGERNAGASPSLRALLEVFDVQPVEKAMDKRRDEDRGDGEEGHAGIECVERREEFRGPRDEVGDLPHPTQDHRRIEERVDPRESRDEVIAEDADRQRDDDEAESHECVCADPLQESRGGKERIRTVLIVEHPAPASPHDSGQFRHGSVPSFWRVRTNGTCETTPPYTPPNTSAIPDRRVGWNGVRSRIAESVTATIGNRT